MNNYAVAAVVLYLLGLVWVGLYGRRQASDSLMFNVFGRRAGVVRATAGYLSLIGGGELLTLSQFGYDNGVGFAWFLSGLAAGFLFLAAFGDRIRAEASALGANTLTGYIEKKYGRTAALGAGLVYVIALGSLLTIQFIVGGDIIAAITGIPRDLTPVIMGAVIVSYLMVAGYVSVLSTDVLRAAILIAVLAVFAYGLAGDFEPAALTTAPYGMIPIADGFPLAVLGMFGVICAADVWQTAIASANRTVLRRSMLGAALVFLVVGSMIALLGAHARDVLPQLAPGMTPLVAAATNALSPELAPLVALLVIGAVMATADTEIWVVATSILSARHGAPAEGEDRDAFQGKMMSQTRTMIPVITLVAVALTYLTRDGQGLYISLLVLLTAIAPAMLAMIFLRPSNLAMALSIWTGILGFAFVSIIYQLAIPLVQSLIPAACSLVGLALGHFVTEFRLGGRMER